MARLVDLSRGQIELSVDRASLPSPHFSYTTNYAITSSYIHCIF